MIADRPVAQQQAKTFPMPSSTISMMKFGTLNQLVGFILLILFIETYLKLTVMSLVYL